MAKLLAWLLGLLARLPAARFPSLTIERAIRIPMADCAELIADRYYPTGVATERLPLLLNRTPYGRMVEGVIARMLAQRGYQVLIVSCRGTFGSAGTWEPLFNEAKDGTAVLRWIARQPWFSGKVGTFGASYHGFTQWAVFNAVPIPLSAASIMQMQSRFVDFVWPSGTFALENVLTWVGSLEYQELPFLKYLSKLRTVKKETRYAANALPVANCDAALVERQVGFFQDWLFHDDRDAAYWTRIDYGRDVSQAPPVLLVAGWFDLFCKGQLDDFVKLRHAGRPVRLIVGPWWHGPSRGVLIWIRESLEWFDAYFQQRPGPAHSVRLFDLGTNRWLDLPDWPPPATRTKWHFAEGRRLLPGPSKTASVDRYRYDPADPTPIVGGLRLNPDEAGPRDNRPVEGRADVLTYTSDALDEDVVVIGSIHVDLYARSSRDHTDFFVRLCDVWPDGRSINLADGIVRLRPQDISRAADGTFRLRLELTPTANTFRRGHCIRVQVASGAHPLHARNPGTGEALSTATRMSSADQQILHGPDYPSAIDLPVVAGDPRS